ncbi:twin-arginine translocase TatA/TatE family subunit [Croceicoccus naphthovorans]|uniref:Sec-independent protein translocase protein TatA n=1 Tax=Croceicoccus naphthovorans TaxID=1348774 RepID=A0A0G3XHV2_9SPHN|nr:twin-arginine translocase TatA/TatE family subunit [Croceicoccus naphthovorans]AKM10782.1 preprotein translocase subunit TatA [Croceicoccus naphthovorans]MBB3988984.1 sec-independent protein translocase protein TatA [Croceicoccus naphthovorans]
MNVGPWQLIIIALVILVLFGRGRISEMMGDFGKGIKSFKQGMNDESGKDALRLDKPQDPAPSATPTATAETQESDKKA